MASLLDSNEESDDWIGFDELKRLTDEQFPSDTDLPFWLWKILLRDIVFFLLMYPGWSLRGCRYRLNVKHVDTGQTREEWLEDIRYNSDSHAYDAADLLNPRLWLINKWSLLSQYHKLFVYDPHWYCNDVTNHRRLLVYTPPAYAELQIDSLVPREQRAVWQEQVRVQRINPCVYSILVWWITCHHRFRV